MRLKNTFSTARRRASWSHLFFFLIGTVFATVACNWSFFEFDSSIEISDFFSAVLGGYIGLYIGSRLTAEVSSNRIEKDLIISDLQASRSNITKLVSFAESGSMRSEDSVNLFKNASSSLVHTMEMVEACKLDHSIRIKVTDLHKKVRSVYRKATNATVQADGTYLFNPADLSGILADLTACNKEYISLIFLVNRA